MTRADTLRDAIEQAQASQPDALKPELGHDIDRARDAWTEARAAERVAAAELAAAVREAVAAGLNVRQAAIRAGVPRATVYRWVAGHPRR